MYRFNRISEDEPHRSVFSLGDLIGHSDLRELWIFNDDVDVDWLLDHLHAPEHIKIRIIYGARQSEIDSAKRQWLSVYRSTWRQRRPVVAWCIPQLNTDGKHNTRLIILKRASGFQIIVLTTKLQPAYWDPSVTHPIWASPLLPFKDENCDSLKAPHHFQQQLMRFMDAYETHGISPPGRSDICQLKTLIESVDFSEIGPVHFVASVPGDWGNIQLPSLLSQSTAAPLAVVNKIGKYVSEDWVSSQPQVDTYIVYPTLNESRSMSVKLEGCFATDPRITESLCPANPPPGRGPCIGNLYLGMTDELSETAEWAIVTSAPLSQESWGFHPEGRNELSGHGVDDYWRILSWNAGVFIDKHSKISTNVRIYDAEMPYFLPCQWPPDIYIPGKDVPANSSIAHENFEIIENQRSYYNSASSQESFHEEDTRKISDAERRPSDAPKTAVGAEQQFQKGGLQSEIIGYEEDKGDCSMNFSPVFRDTVNVGGPNIGYTAATDFDAQEISSSPASKSSKSPTQEKVKTVASQGENIRQFPIVRDQHETPNETPNNSSSGKKIMNAKTSSKKKRRVVPFSRDKSLRREFNLGLNNSDKRKK